jgi:hypothetical protein
VNLRRSNCMLVAMLCFAAAKLDARQSSVPDKDAVSIDIMESSEQTMELIIGATRNGAKSVVLWNLVLDQNHQAFLGGARCDVA